MTNKQKIYFGAMTTLIVLACVLNVAVWAQTHVYVLNGVPYIFPPSQGTTGTLLTNNGSGTLSWSAAPTPEGIWTGGAMLSTVNCPSGWTRDTAGGGRYLVITPSGGTNSGTSGTALTNLEARDHTHTGPSHQHFGPSHGHPWNGGFTGPESGLDFHSINYTPGGATSGWSNPGVGHSHSPGSLDIGQSGTGATSAGGTGLTGGTSAVIAPFKQLILCVKD